MKGTLLLTMLVFMQIASAASPPNAPGLAMLSEAERMFEQGDSLKALSLYQAILEQDRNNPRVWLRVAELYKREGRSSQALQAYAEVSRIYPSADSAPEAGELLAQAHLECARLYAQLAQQELALARDPPAGGELQRAIAQADRALLGMQSVAEPRSTTRATGQSIEIRYVTPGEKPLAKPSASRIPVIRGAGSRSNSDSTGDLR